MNKKKFTKLLALYLPYLVIGLAATNLGEAWRLAEGKELGDRIVSLIDALVDQLKQFDAEQINALTAFIKTIVKK